MELLFALRNYYLEVIVRIFKNNLHDFPRSLSAGSTSTTPKWECTIVCAVMLPFSGVSTCLILLLFIFRNVEALCWKDSNSTLNSSEAKYDSGTGWPSFKEAHGTWGQDESHTSIIRRPDNSLGSAGTEVLCKNVSGIEMTQEAEVQLCVFGHSSHLCVFYSLVRRPSGSCVWRRTGANRPAILHQQRRFDV